MSLRTSLALMGTLCVASASVAEDLVVATTTSVEDSGLLDALVPVFEKQTGLNIRIVAVGTGAALRMGSQGDADVLLTHAPKGEKELVATGAVLERHPFMENYFVIAGPAGDPAKVSEARNGADALARVAGAEMAYVSRGDDSGTHRREKALLEAAGLDPDGSWPGFARTGTGMGITLQVAGERRAYVLSDIATLLAFQERTGLTPLTKPSPDLRNVYSVMRVNPERFPGQIEAEAARLFAAFLQSAETQRRIERFGVKRFGRPLFRPLLLEVTDTETP